MIQGKAIIQSPLGIHARPAAYISACCKKSMSDVIISFKGNSVDPGNYIKLMGLNIKCGDEIEIIVEGSDEQVVYAELINILENA